jgi:transmembrane 9 superfamily protein 2/4
LKKKQRQQFVDAIDNDYRVHWIVDGLPVATLTASAPASSSQAQSAGGAPQPQFTRGFPVGFSTGSGKNKRHFLNNHVRIIIQYHDDVDSFIEGSADESSTKIVGFRVEPMSIKHQWEGKEFVPGSTVLSTCNAMVPPTNDPRNYLVIDGAENVVFTYDVFWEKSATEWSNRWDLYITANSNNDQVHWFSISNSFMIVIFLSIMIAVILHRTLRKDIQMYNDPTALEEAKDESGWKLVHGDVFRPPATAPMLFSVLIGTGMQLGLMITATLAFSFMGLLSPTNRGSLVTGLIFLYVVMGAFAGYYSSMTYKMFRGTEWKNNVLMTAFLFPSIVFGVFFILNIILWAEGSSGAVPFGTLFVLLFLWFCVSVPLVSFAWPESVVSYLTVRFVARRYFWARSLGTSGRLLRFLSERTRFLVLFLSKLGT